MVVRDVATSSYAVVTYRGSIDDGIKAIYQHYWQEWLPSSEYQPVQGPEFEYYDHQFLGTLNPDSIMKLYFPVKKKD
jgi:predicted transcriptional regulator YdeE